MNGVFGGIGALIDGLIVCCVVVAVPLAVWKLVDIVIWCCQHVTVGVK